jgi:ribosomal protein S18 acetylase RimI-like enzyme
MPATPSTVLVPGVTLRPIGDPDLPFLRALYGSTREEELAPVPWSDAQKRAFLDQQFAAQHQHYAQAYAHAEFAVIERDGRPIGRLYLDRGPAELRIVDIALMPEARNQGIGGALLGAVIAQGRSAGVPVGIHVEKLNPARRLYERLGFREVDDRGVYVLMHWTPGGLS